GWAAPRRLRDRRRLGPRSRASALDRLNRRIASSSVAPIRPGMNAPCVLALLGSQPSADLRDRRSPLTGASPLGLHLGPTGRGINHLDPGTVPASPAQSVGRAV